MSTVILCTQSVGQDKENVGQKRLLDNTKVSFWRQEASWLAVGL